MNLKLISAFAAIYIVWGSTYLAILYGIETIPPWMMTSLRFIVASLCLGAVAVIKKEAALSPLEKKVAVISGVLMILANGIVCIMEKYVSSGIAAVVIGAMPIWIMVIGWVGFGTGQPHKQKIIGALIGLFGIAWIAAGDLPRTSSSMFGAFAPLVLCVSSVLWAIGTLIQKKHLTHLKSGFSFLSLQMGSGAAAAALMCFVFESPLSFDYSTITGKSWLALSYLIVFGSLIGFASYSWLSRNVEPHLVSTYALVNPVIAVFLGWLLANESLTGSFLTATVLVLVGLSILMMKPLRRSA